MLNWVSFEYFVHFIYSSYKYLKLNTFEFLRTIRVRQKFCRVNDNRRFTVAHKIDGNGYTENQSSVGNGYIYIHIPVSFHRNSSSKKQRKSGWLSFSYVQYYESCGERAIRALIFNCLSIASIEYVE